MSEHDLNSASCATTDSPERLPSVGQRIDGGRLREAREPLESSAGEPAEVIELSRLELAVAARELEPSSALQTVIAFLRKDPRHPAALRLYRELSMLQFQAGQSCPSNSHPPPARGR